MSIAVARVMIVEPNVEHLEVYNSTFLNYSCRTLPLVKGNDAISAFEQFLPHLIVSDMVLQDQIRAWQVAHWILRPNPVVRPYMVVLTSNQNEPWFRQQKALCLETGFDEIAAKTETSVETLLDWVQKAVTRPLRANS